MNPTSIEVIAAALGGTYTARGDAVAVVEDLHAAGFTIIASSDGRPDTGDSMSGEPDHHWIRDMTAGQRLAAIKDMVKDFREHPHDDAEQIINDLEAWTDDWQ